MSKHDAETDMRDLLGNLASIKLDTPDDQLPDRVRKLVEQARDIVPRLGPILRSPEESALHDDYLAVRQIAVAIGRDGKMHFSQRTDGELPHLIPLMAGIEYRHSMDMSILADQLNMSDEDMRGR